MLTHSTIASGRLRRSTAYCVAFLLLSSALYGQMRETTRPQRNSAQSDRAELSDLAKENLDLVAASSIQIREILVRDAGLFVELKRGFGKEASDNGQAGQELNLWDAPN